MPWIKDSNDEDKYIASKFAKEELPTWNEVYNEWYKKYKDDLYTYRTERDTEIDTYWKIPKKKYLLAAVCNQFNKMIFEDKLDIEYTLDLRFALYPDFQDQYIDEFPTIYTFKNPRGNENPFITLSQRHLIIENEDCEMVILYKNNSSEMQKIDDINTMNCIVEKFMQPFINYFENGIGWKDENGNIIEEKKIRWERTADSAL